MKKANEPNKTKLPTITVSIIRGKGSPAQIRQFREAFNRLLLKAQEAEHE